MQTLKDVAQQARFAAMQPGAISERKALNAAIDTASAYQPEQIVLKPMPSEGLRVKFRPCDNSLSVETADYRTVAHIQRDYDGDDPRWYGSTKFLDQHGREWSHFGYFVCDDFGSLVEVPR